MDDVFGFVFASSLGFASTTTVVNSASGIEVGDSIVTVTNSDAPFANVKDCGSTDAVQSAGKTDFVSFTDMSKVNVMLLSLVTLIVCVFFPPAATFKYGDSV